MPISTAKQDPFIFSKDVTLTRMTVVVTGRLSNFSLEIVCKWIQCEFFSVKNLVPEPRKILISVPSLIKTYRACSLQVIQTLSCYLIGRINEWKCYVTTSPDWENTIYFDTIRYYLIVFVDVINGVSLPFGQEKWLRNVSNQSNSKIGFE